MNKLRVVELFSGIGAWSKALESLGIPHEVVLAVDHDKFPVTAYNAIHNTDFSPIDIETLDPNDVPDCDIICYSPPCQSFSSSGKQLGFKDERGILFFDAMRIISAKKPRYALMENVKGLTQKFKKEFDVMLERLESAGYKNYWKIINSKDQNVAQNRERVFVISIRNDIDKEFEFPNPIELKKNISNYIEEDASATILHTVLMKGCSLRTRSYMGQPQQLEIRKDNLSNAVTTVPKDFMIAIVDDIYKGRDVRIYEKYCPTIRSGRKGFKIVAKVGDKYSLVKDSSDVKDDQDYFFIREMSTLEAFRFMGFTDEDYEKARLALNNTYYKGKDKSQTRLYKLAGNSIVVDVCERLFEQLLPEYIPSKKE